MIYCTIVNDNLTSSITEDGISAKVISDSLQVSFRDAGHIVAIASKNYLVAIREQKVDLPNPDPLVVNGVSVGTVLYADQQTGLEI